MNNPLNNLKIEGWYHVFVILGAIFLGLSLTVEMKYIDNTTVQLLSLSSIFIGLGEWCNHPFNEIDRELRWSGIILDLIGVLIFLTWAWEFVL